MQLSRKSFVSAMLIAGLALSGLSGRSTAQTPAAAAPPPTKLAVVNLVQLFDGLIEKTDGEVAIEKMKKDLEDQGDKMNQAVQDQQKALNALNAGTPAYQQAQQALLKASMNVQAFSSFAQQTLLVELLSRKAGLYKKINDEVAEYAQNNGIALVFVADSSSMKGMSNPDQLTAMIQMRKVLYFHPDFDITEKVKGAMNTKYQLGQTTH